MCILSQIALYMYCQKIFFSAAPVNSLKAKTINSGCYDNDCGVCQKSIRKSQNLVFRLEIGNTSTDFAFLSGI